MKISKKKLQKQIEDILAHLVPLNEYVKYKDKKKHEVLNDENEFRVTFLGEDYFVADTPYETIKTIVSIKKEQKKSIEKKVVDSGDICDVSGKQITILVYEGKTYLRMSEVNKLSEISVQRTSRRAKKLGIRTSILPGQKQTVIPIEVLPVLLKEHPDKKFKHTNEMYERVAKKLGVDVRVVALILDAFKIDFDKALERGDVATLPERAYIRKRFPSYKLKTENNGSKESSSGKENREENSKQA